MLMKPEEKFVGIDVSKATGKLAKTDCIDAQTLALFGQTMRPEVRPLKDEQSRERDALFVRRRQRIERLTMEKNRLGQAAKRVRKSLQAHIFIMVGAYVTSEHANNKGCASRLKNE